MPLIKWGFTIILVIFGFSLVNVIQAQDHSKQIVLKYYSSIHYKKAMRQVLYNPLTQSLLYREEQSFHLIPFIPALCMKVNERHFIEASCTELSFKHNNKMQVGSYPITELAGGQISETAIAFQFEEYWALGDPTKASKWQARLGWALSAGFAQEKTLSNISSRLPTRFQETQLRASVVPRMIYTLSNKWFLDFNLPIGIAEFSHGANRVDNPGLPIQNRTAHVVSFKMLPPFFSFRMGVGLKL